MPFSGLPCSVNEENPLFLDHVRGERMDFHSYVSLLEGIPLVHVQKSHHIMFVVCPMISPRNPLHPHINLDEFLFFLMMYIILPMFRDILTLLPPFSGGLPPSTASASTLAGSRGRTSADSQRRSDAMRPSSGRISELQGAPCSMSSKSSSSSWESAERSAAVI